MDPSVNQQDESMVVIKSTPFYKQDWQQLIDFRSRKFFVGMGVLLGLVVAGSFFTYRQFTTSTTSLQEQTQTAQTESTKPIGSLLGIIRAIDTSKNVLTVQINSADKSKGGSFKSYLVSNDVLVTQQVLGVKKEEMKQSNLPTEILVLSSLKKKNGTEAYLVFDEKGEKVVQIQMYARKK